MGEQRTGDDIVLKVRGGDHETIGFRGGVRELDNSSGDLLVADQRGSKFGDDKDLKFALVDPKFGEWDTIFYKAREDKGSDFGRDTNKLEYFMVVPFNVQGDDDLTGITSCDGGGGGRTLLRGQGAVAGTRLELKRGSASGGDRRRQITNWDFEVVVEHEQDCGRGYGLKRIGSEGRGSRWWKKWCCCWHCGK